MWPSLPIGAWRLKMARHGRSNRWRRTTEPAEKSGQNGDRLALRAGNRAEADQPATPTVMALLTQAVAKRVSGF